MSTTTTNLALFEYDPVADANQTYNITNALNNNWDIIDSSTGKLSELTTTEKGSLVGAINELNNSSKADTDLSNLSPNGQAVIDGQWVNVNVQLVDNVTYPTTEDLTYDLSNILPNDNNNYEILLVGAVITGSTSGDDVTLGVQSDILNGHYSSCICGARTRTNSTVYGYGTVILPISTSRNLYVRHSSTYEGTFTLRVVGYRRIGTNN